jgi:hypothetical protein
MKTINAIDIEVIVLNDRLVPYCLCLSLWETSHVFWGFDCVKAGLDFLFSKKKKILLYAHNLTFDGSIILQNYNLQNLFIDGIFDKGTIFQLILNNGFSEIEFKCSFKFLPLKLEEIAPLVGEKKKYFPHKFVTLDNLNYIGAKPAIYFYENICHKEYSKLPAAFNLKSSASEYCKTDVLITKLVITKIQAALYELLNVNNCYSIAAVAYKIFETNFNYKKLKTRLNIRDDEIFRRGYFGGRCEVFGNPEGYNIYHYDYTGMYTQVMQERFPFGEYKISYNVAEICTPGFYQIEGTSNMYLPVLPHHSISGKLLFTNGCIQGLFWFEELLLFLKEGGKITKINYGIFFEKFDFCLDHFANFFSAFRKKNSLNNILGKLIPNSLFGRFGMSNRHFDTKISVDGAYLEKGNTVLENKINGICIRTIESQRFPDSVDSNVILACCITAKARIKLYEGLSAVIRRGGRILYTDTDSIFAEFKENVSNQKIGDIFLDTSKFDTEIKDAVFVSGKLYSVVYKSGASKIKIKGIKHEISHEKLKFCFYNNLDISVDNLILKKANYLVKVANVKKTISLSAYSKRRFSQDKKNTSPLFFNENGTLS